MKTHTLSLLDVAITNEILQICLKITYSIMLTMHFV